MSYNYSRDYYETDEYVYATFTWRFNKNILTSEGDVYAMMGNIMAKIRKHTTKKACVKIEAAIKNILLAIYNKRSIDKEGYKRIQIGRNIHVDGMIFKNDLFGDNTTVWVYMGKNIK